MTNNEEHKYVMIVTSEDERYDSGEKDLCWFAEHPWEGTLVEIVFGNSFDELMGDGEHEGLFQQTYEMETGKRLSYGFLDPDTPREEIEEWEKNHEEFKYKYYEVTFRRHARLSDTYSICIKATRKPDFGEAEEFCKNMKKMNYDYIEDVTEITKDEAYKFFDMENENKWPIFGEE